MPRMLIHRKPASAQSIGSGRSSNVTVRHLPMASTEMECDVV